MDLLRVSTAGSVDDGKSTLIGRLLFDSGALSIEQEELIRKKSEEKGLKDLDFSVITDGLVAEREQGITIDVAHIYYASQDRKFIISDSPGHEEYTRNMVTGASTADSSIILIDARKGLQPQSFRHFYISSLLQLKHVIFCVNKMDLVDYSEDRFLEIAVDIKKMVNKLDLNAEIHILPISSLKGDNVLHVSSNMDWYQGNTLNEILHKIPSQSEQKEELLFDVQLQLQDRVLGRLLGGKLELGAELVAYPSGKKVTISEIYRGEEKLDTAEQGDSLSLGFNESLADLGRGTVLSSEKQWLRKEFIEASLVWMDDTPFSNDTYLIKSGSQEAKFEVNKLYGRINPLSFELESAHSALKINDIANIQFSLDQPLVLPSYTENKALGAFILINPKNNNTAAVGFIK